MAENQQAKQFVDEKIRQKKVVIFSKSQCPFCLKAKNVMAEYKLPADQYEVLELDDNPLCSEIQAYLKTITNASSVPRVFINGKCIGGGDDTVRLHNSKELEKLLQCPVDE